MARGGGVTVTVATVVERSSNDPAFSEDLDYTLEFLFNGEPAYRVENARPSWRVTDDIEAPLKLIPFALGRRVIVSVESFGGREDVQIHESEPPFYEECE